MATPSTVLKDDKRADETKGSKTTPQGEPPPSQDPTPHGKYESVVRCSEGHLFTTIWIPLVSFKAVRLGNERWQRCPVGSHWTRVHRVPDAELTNAERAEAAAYHDSRIP